VIGSAANVVIRSKIKAKSIKHMETKRKQKVPLGQVDMTPGAGRAMAESGDNLWDFIRHHQSGD
jgi:hypothetical protein